MLRPVTFSFTLAFVGHERHSLVKQTSQIYRASHFEYLFSTPIKSHYQGQYRQPAKLHSYQQLYRVPQYRTTCFIARFRPGALDPSETQYFFIVTMKCIEAEDILILLLHAILPHQQIVNNQHRHCSKIFVKHCCHCLQIKRGRIIYQSRSLCINIASSTTL